MNDCKSSAFDLLKANADACETDLDEMGDTCFDIYYEVKNNTVDPNTLVTQVETVVHDG